MRAWKIVLSTFTATTAMTLFSYVLSWLTHENFREPYILSMLIMSLFPDQENTTTLLEAWILHYCVGLCFIIIYAWIWNRFKRYPNLESGTILGVVTGLFAVLVWHLTLKVFDNPPVTNRLPFYIQLVFAHVVFGIIAALSYRTKLK